MSARPIARPPARAGAPAVRAILRNARRLCLPALYAFALACGAEDTPDPLAAIVQQFPERPLMLSGVLRQSGGAGAAREFQVDLFLHRAGSALTSVYSVRDRFGRDLEQLTVLRDGGLTRYEYAAGESLTAAPPPPLSDAVQGTDVTWTDLTLGFLWWPHTREPGAATIKGKACMLLLARPPAGAETGVAYARLWVGTGAPILLQAEAFTEDNALLRRLRVRSLKMVDDLWMIRELEVETPGAGSRTRLTLRDGRAVGGAGGTH
jgi:hypothetical protein